MSKYLLSCSCGRRTVVSARQAGQAIRCECGASLDVPTLRGLRDLPAAESEVGAGRQRVRAAWENPQRAAFAMALVAVMALAASGYCAWRTPPRIVPAEPKVLDEKSSPAETLDVFNELQTQAPPPRPWIVYNEQRDAMLWGAWILGVLGAALVAGAAGTLWWHRGPETPKPESPKSLTR